MSWLGQPASETQITHGRRLWLYAVAVLVMLFLIAPTVIVIPMSFSESQYLEFPPRTWSTRWYDHYLGSIEWISATKTSLIAAFLTMCVATPMGTMAAYGLFTSNLRAASLGLQRCDNVDAIDVEIGEVEVFEQEPHEAQPGDVTDPDVTDPDVTVGN